MPTLAKPKAAPATEAPKSRRPAEDDDDDIETTRTRRSEKPDADDDGPVGEAGWGAGDNVATPSGFAANLKLEKGETAVFKFLEAAPYANLRVHWVERKGKRSFICTKKADCPLCVAGADVQSEHRFNIALLTEAEPVLRSLNVSYAHFNEFKEYNSKTPLTKRFYTRTRPSKPGGRYKHVELRYEDDVETDYPNLHIPTDSEIAALLNEGVYDLDAVSKERTSKGELEKIAAEITGEGDYDDD